MRQETLLRSLVGLTVCALAVGSTAWTFGGAELAEMTWAAGTVIALLPATWWLPTIRTYQPYPPWLTPRQH